MGSFLENLWNKLISNLGQFGALLGVVIGQLSTAIKARDVAKINRICDDLDELAGDLTTLTVRLRANVADGVLTAAEGAASALDLEELIADLAKAIAKHPELKSQLAQVTQQAQVLAQDRVEIFKGAGSGTSAAGAPPQPAELPTPPKTPAPVAAPIAPAKPAPTPAPLASKVQKGK